MLMHVVVVNHTVFHNEVKFAGVLFSYKITYVFILLDTEAFETVDAPPFRRWFD